MFRVIIVDEPSVSKALLSFVDYEKYNLEIAECFDCAEDAIKYIRTNYIDAVICASRLKAMTGLDLLKTLYVEFPHIKMILTSPYRDFEYIKKCLTFHAFAYISRPIQLDEYTQALSRLQEYLEKQDENQFLGKEQIFLFEELLSDYFDDIISETVFTERILSSYVKPTLLNEQCAILTLSLENFEDYLSNIWHHGQKRLMLAIRQIISLSPYSSEFFLVSTLSDHLFFLATSNGEKDFEASISQFIEYITTELASIFLLKATVTVETVGSNIFDLKAHLPHTLHSSSSHLVSSTITHLLNKNFKDIKHLRNLFTKLPSLYEQQQFCIRLSDAVSKGYLRALKFEPLSHIALSLILNPQTLLNYFDDLIASYRLQSEYMHREKTVILDAIRYVDKNFSADISLASTARNIRLNPSYFSAFFKKHTGLRFSDFLLRVRLEHAKLLLRKNSSMKIRAICHEVGYKSLPYFYKVFEEYTGFTPTEYRERAD